MLVPLGLWVGIIGYTVLYSGVIKLGGGTCSLAQAFRGQCKPGGPAGPATDKSQAKTPTNPAQAAANQQFASLPLAGRSSGNQAIA